VEVGGPAPVVRDPEVVVAQAAPRDAGAASCGCETGGKPPLAPAAAVAVAVAAAMRRRRRKGGAVKALAAALALLAGCRAPAATTAEDGDEPREQADAPVPTVAGDLCALPMILRCPTPHSGRGGGRTLAARARRRDGVLELLTPVGFSRDFMPVVLDAERVFYPGFAAFKRDLSAIELDWRSLRVRSLGDHAEQLIVVDEHGVYLLPKDGSPHLPLTSDANVWSAAAGPSFVAWTVDTSGMAQRDAVVVASRSGEVIQVIEGEDSPYGALIAGDSLLWFTFGHTGPEAPSGAIRKLDQGAPVTLAGGQYVPRQLAVAGEHVYWVTDEHGGRFARRVPLAGGAIEQLGVSHGASRAAPPRSARRRGRSSAGAAGPGSNRRGRGARGPAPRCTTHR
jgi:MYXO-CTERM domain-containing protein